MRNMKVYDLMIKNIKQIMRDKKNLFFILLFPAIFMLVFAVAFGGESIESSTIQIALVNNDNITSYDYSTQLVKEMGDVNLSTNDKKVFNITECTNINEANDKLKQSEVSMIIIIPENFSNNIQKSFTNTKSTTDITIKGDPTQSSYGLGLNVINTIINEYTNNMKAQLTKTTPTNTIELKQENIEGTSQFTQFDYIAPGLIIFAILMTVTTVATNISEETENGMLKRLKLSHMTSTDYIISNLLSWSLVGMIQVIIMLIVALLLNFHWVGDTSSLIIACIIGFITTISSVSLALIIVSLTSSAEQASQLSAIIAVPLSFISGSFFPLPEIYIGTICGHLTQIYEILPWNQALTALRKVLIYGSTLGDVAVNLLLIIVMGCALLIISIFLFRRKIKTEN